jgi:hypothetical protein
VTVASSKVNFWIINHNIEILNVAGSCASKDPKLYEIAKYIIEGVILLTLVNAEPGLMITDYSKEAYLKKLPVPPKTVMEMIHVYADATDQVTIICPKCGFVNNIDIKKFKDAHSKLKARCRCGEVFRVAMDFRKYCRKHVKFSGEYTLKEKKERGEILVEDISMTGIGFSTLRPHHISGNDKVELKFTLDNPKRTEIHTPVKIKWIVDRHIGAEFIDLDRFKQDLVFYLRK